MALILDVTVGGPNANSYATQAEADTYFEGRLNAGAWTAASATQKAQSLVAASSRIDQEHFLGKKAATTQRMKWPRTNVPDDDGTIVDSNSIPREVKEATFEVALALLTAGSTDILAATGLEQFKSIDAGGVALELRGDLTEEERNALPPQAARLLRPFLMTYKQPYLPTSVRLSRG